MRTYLFSDEDLRRYARDLAIRLTGLGESFPYVWFTLGESGDKIAEVLQPLIKPKSVRERIRIGPIYYNRTTKKVLARDGSKVKRYPGPVLLIDGAVHSGASMNEAAKEITKKGMEVISYAFVVKRTSIFIPNFFGILIDEHDRPYFQLDVIPNNNLREASPFGNLRRIRSEDAKSTTRFLRTGVPSIDRTSLGDLWFSDQTEGSIVYVYEHSGRVVAFISLRRNGTDSVYIEMVAADEAYKGIGIGGLLMRWAGTFARSCCCAAMELRAHLDRVSFYAQYGFESLGEQTDIGEGEAYVLMRKKIIYDGNPAKMPIL